MNSWKSRVEFGVLAAVQHVHHRRWQTHRARPAEIGVQRQAVRQGGGARHRLRRAENGVRPETRLVFRAVQIDQRPVDPPLFGRIASRQQAGDLGIDVIDRVAHALSLVARGVAVAQFGRLMFAGRGAGGNRRRAGRAVGQGDDDADRGEASGIQDFDGADRLYEGRHCDFPLARAKKVTAPRAPRREHGRRSRSPSTAIFAPAPSITQKSAMNRIKTRSTPIRDR